jgi:hypothetical protein
MRIEDGEARFTIVVIGTTDPLELVRALHGSAKPEHRSELESSDEADWSRASFHMRFPSLQAKGHPVRATLSGHRGAGLRNADTARLEAAFDGADVVVVRASSDPEDDLNTASSTLAQAKVAPDAIVLFEAPTGTPALQAAAPARFAPRSTHVLLGESTPLDVLKLAIKAMLARANG